MSENNKKQACPCCGEDIFTEGMCYDSYVAIKQQAETEWEYWNISDKEV